MTRLIVNTSSYVDASDGLSSAQVFLHQGLDGLKSGLANAAGMAGNDDAGIKFAHDYDEAAQNLAGGITDAITGAGALSRLLADTANVWADAEHYASGGVSPLGLAYSAADTSDLSGTCSAISPTAQGGNTNGVPQGWEWIQSVVGAVWPNGDTGKLRAAQKTWEHAGDDLRSAAWKVDAAISSLGGLATPEIDLVHTKLNQYRGYLNDLSTGAYQLGQACTGYADAVDEAHTAIIHELIELLAITVAIEAGSALLAVFTVGASEVVGNAALMARIGLTGTRVVAMIGRLTELATTIGTRIAGIAGAITRTLGFLRELKVVKTLTYLGTKAPLPLRVMTGLSINSAIGVGIDAAAHGGTPANPIHDIVMAGVTPFGVGAVANSIKAGTKSAVDAGVGAVLRNGMITTNGIARIPLIELKFIKNLKHDPIEFRRQIAGQELGLNSMTVANFLRNRDQLSARLAAGLPIRPSEAAAAQLKTRSIAFEAKLDELLLAGIPMNEAKLQASAWLGGQAALHNPDIIAGGFPTIMSGVGDSRINSSIGAQWQSRIEDFDARVRDIAIYLSETERETTLIHVKLNY
ncbi:polymorphic toxin type 15 domain-containing protein [Psychromicrobium xiongbiense]|uniref:polymorphic toxin type 15 domain-containing protein n=1 Tax=Psychromicrobium xiongbiense TaxID=3051184 RepID=UPI0025577776|nr:polymorphic toxin type 15 domain-containing protein [Psychromicrobium sp. YIM S02556]